MGLLENLLAQGVDEQTASDWVDERERLKKPIAGRSYCGRWIKFSQAKPEEIERVNRMLEEMTPPGTSNTDRSFLQGTECGRQFQDNPQAGDFYKREAEKHGRKIDNGDVYKSSLARFPGDPRAWVSSRHDVAKLQEERRVEEEKAAGPVESVDIADKIVNRETAIELSGQTVTGREYKDTREKVKKRLTPSWKKKK